MRVALAAVILASSAATAAYLHDETTPAAAPEPAVKSAYAPPAVAITKADDGHYWAEAQVNGVRVRFMVDTGASVVALTETDAKRAGLDTDALVYDRPVSTAAGSVLAAGVHLERVSVSGIEQRGVDALVMPKGLATSLLGMSYLGRLSRIEATRDSLILRR